MHVKTLHVGPFTRAMDEILNMHSRPFMAQGPNVSRPSVQYLQKVTRLQVFHVRQGCTTEFKSASQFAALEREEENDIIYGGWRMS